MFLAPIAKKSFESDSLSKFFESRMQYFLTKYALVHAVVQLVHSLNRLYATSKFTGCGNGYIFANAINRVESLRSEGK